MFALVSGADLPAWSAAAGEDNLLGHIMGMSGAIVGVDMDVFHELKPGDLGILMRSGVRIASVEVVRADHNDVFLRALGNTKDFSPLTGDTAYFTAADPSSARPEAGAGLGGEDLVPLLTPLPVAKKITPYKLSSRASGRVMFRQFYQAITPGAINQRITRADTDGAIERFGGGPWSFNWSGSGSYFNGNRPSISKDFRRFRPRARLLALSRPLGEGGFFRAGRFFPKELPGLGTVDGLALEAPVGWLRIGGVAGTRPERLLQGFSSREQLGALYASSESGTPGQGSYAATLGVMHTLWLGKSDELALLFDQNFDLGPLLNVYQTLQVDVNDDAAQFHEGARLTRLDLSLNSNLKKWLTVRGGVNHFEPIDAAAERAFIGGGLPLVMDTGYWRFWTGSGQSLPAEFNLDEEISWTRIDGRLQPGLWRATIGRQGLPWKPEGRAYVTGYNVSGPAGTDYGGSTGVTLPLLNGKLILDTNAGFRYDRGAASERILRLGDASLRLDWRPNRAWQVEAVSSTVKRGSAGSSTFSGGLSYRW